MSDVLPTPAILFFLLFINVNLSICLKSNKSNNSKIWKKKTRITIFKKKQKTEIAKYYDIQP